MIPDDLQDCRHEKVMETLGAFLARKQAEDEMPPSEESQLLSPLMRCGLDEPKPADQ